jgi:hypothetical protein
MRTHKTIVDHLGFALSLYSDPEVLSYSFLLHSGTL